MSYAHTKRRKLIRFLKRSNPRDWRRDFNYLRELKIRQIDGPLIGSLQDIMDSGKMDVFKSRMREAMR